MDNVAYWSNEGFEERFNSSQLIPKYIGDKADVLIKEYREKLAAHELQQGNQTENETAFEYDRHSVVKTLFLLKEISIAPMYSGQQPTFRGPQFHALLMGERRWIMFRPDKAFAMKQNAIEFFCYHESLTEDKMEQLEYLTFTQKPGDLVFVPNEWGFGWISMVPSIGVSVELYM